MLINVSAESQHTKQQITKRKCRVWPADKRIPKRKTAPQTQSNLSPIPRPGPRRPRQRQPLQRSLHPPTQPRPLPPTLPLPILRLFRLSDRPRALLQHIRDRHTVRQPVEARENHLGVGSDRLELIGLAQGLRRVPGFEQRFISRA
jgi:hypothetical protein